MLHKADIDDDEITVSFLRPDFTISLAKQSKWHDHAHGVVRDSGAQFGELTKDSINAFTTAERRLALDKCFRSLKATYGNQQKPEEKRIIESQIIRRQVRRSNVS